ncbi:type II toxin-antitoxin system RelE/ParE family toxin [Prosthecobacter dejongeii]|uniref:type II toxin-antitoxin system RelE/ParE family toxin n=1 Tax=Prosthecobacter dejongeii TaxID=48465 RepID=UPI00161B0AA5
MPDDSKQSVGWEKLKSALLPGTREIKVFKASYRIIYRVEADQSLVYVLRFWHSHRAEPDSF